MPGGRPTKYTELNLAQVREVAAEGWTDEKMATFFGVHRSTWAEWKTKHEEFRDTLKIDKEFSDRLVEQSLYKKATGYTNSKGEEIPPDTTSAIFWLKNRQPAKWRDKQQLEHTGKDGSALIPATVNFLSTEEIKAKINKEERDE